MRRSILLCLLLLAPGCSFWAVRGPDRNVARGGDCTTSVAAPVVDGVFAAGLLGLGIAGVSDQKPDCSGWGCLDFSSAAHGAGWGFIGLAVVETAAMAYGAVNVARCKDVRASVELPPTVSAAPGLDLRRAPVVETR